MGPCGLGCPVGGYMHTSRRCGLFGLAGAEDRRTRNCRPGRMLMPCTVTRGPPELHNGTFGLSLNGTLHL